MCEFTWCRGRGDGRVRQRPRQLSATFWGKAWSDLASRLPRGRTYLRNGSVLDLAIAEGRVEAHVAGSELYREMTLYCSCPDAAEVCKHVAAVLYGVGIRLDAMPELFFVLRQVDQAALLSSATAGVVSPAVGRRIGDDRLSAVFGIELEKAPPARPGRPTGRGKTRR